MKKLICMLLFLTSCSSAGPFITGFEPTPNGMVVKSCYVEFMPLFSTIMDGDCDTQYISNDNGKIPSALAGHEKPTTTGPIINNVIK